MRGSASSSAKAVYSFSQIGAAADATGVAVDCLGFEEALLLLVTGAITVATSQLVKWQESALPTSGFVDIPLAVHKSVMFDANDIVASVNLTNTTLTIAAQPVNPSRLTITVVDTTPSITVGNVTIIGTDANSLPVTEVVAFTAAATKITTTIFKTITSIVTTAFATLGGAGDETIVIGPDNSGAEVPHMISLKLTNRQRYIRALSTKTGAPLGSISAIAILMAPKVYPTVQANPAEVII